jgi:hypothetical protein
MDVCAPPSPPKSNIWVVGLISNNFRKISFRFDLNFLLMPYNLDFMGLHRLCGLTNEANIG